MFGMVVLSPTLWGQAPGESETGPLTTDWSDSHLIFSKPATAERAARVEQDPRYQRQLHRHSVVRLVDGQRSEGRTSRSNIEAAPAVNAHGDWAQFLGNNGTVGATNYPAKYSFNINQASCANDFAVYTTGLLGSSGQATVVAFNNLYSGCTGTVPSVYWAYNNKGTPVSSPFFSRDGTQVAFVQAGGGFKSTVVLFKWAASASESVSSPMTLSGIFRGFYPGCSAPCTTLLDMRDGSGNVDADSNSALFYDYSSDTGYVGDDDGWLHKYNPFFNGTPGEVRTGGWPVQVNPGSLTPALTSPVFDNVSGNVFVTDKGGFLYRVDSTGAVTASGQLDFSTANDGGPGFVQGPIVDSSAGFVYVFATSDGSGGCLGTSDCTAVFQLPVNFSATTTPSEAVVGVSTLEPAVPNPLYLGAFDSAYENSVTATGHLYVCGNTGGPPVLYQVAIQNGTLGTVSAGPVLSTSTSTPCSPVTDVYNPNASGGITEWLFASVENGGAATGCSSGGCIFNLKDTAWQPSTAYVIGQEVLDSNLHIQVVSVAGTSGASAPFWNISTGGSTSDHTVTWLDQGPASAFTLPAWTGSHHYTKGTEILDAHNNVELVTTAGNSGGSLPSFNITPGLTTHDGTVTWTNVGAIATAAAAEAGGTSGMVIDNVVGSSIQAGASNIYFSTLSNQNCGTSGTGGCAVQASQAGLQ